MTSSVQEKIFRKNKNIFEDRRNRKRIGMQIICVKNNKLQVRVLWTPRHY